MNKYLFWRLIAIGSSLFVIASFAITTFSIHFEDRSFYIYALIPLGIFMLYSIIHQMRFPLDLRIYIIWTFIFSLMCTAYGTTALGCLIGYYAFFLGNQIRFFNSKKILKYVILGILYVVSFLSLFRLDKTHLIDSIGEFLIAITAILLMHLITKHLLKRINQDIFLEMQKEDINDYFSDYAFTERDKKMLQEVLDGHKYEEIAINHNLSISSVKKRLGYLYKILGVTCQIDFIIKFSKKTDNNQQI